LICLIYCTLFYFITGYQASAAKFAIFLAVCVLVTLISETIGGICALLTKTATMGIMLSSTLLTVNPLTLAPLLPPPPQSAANFPVLRGRSFGY